MWSISGQSLTDLKQPLVALGLKNRCKVLLIGKKVSLCLSKVNIQSTTVIGFFFMTVWSTWRREHEKDFSYGKEDWWSWKKIKCKPRWAWWNRKGQLCVSFQPHSIFCNVACQMYHANSLLVGVSSARVSWAIFEEVNQNIEGNQWGVYDFSWELRFSG